MSKRDKTRAAAKLEREATELGIVTAGRLSNTHRRPRLGEVGAIGGPGASVGAIKGSLESVAFATSIHGGVTAAEKSRLLAKRRLLQEVLQPMEAPTSSSLMSGGGGGDISSSRRTTTGRHTHHASGRSQMSKGGAATAPLPGGGFDDYPDDALPTPVPTDRQLLAPLTYGGGPQPSPTPTANHSMFLSKLSQADAALSVKRSRNKVLPGVQEAASHSPASFMAEITAFVEGEIRQLDRRFPPSTSDLTHGRMPTTSLLPSDVALRRAGGAPPTHEESKRALRVGIFTNAQRMFADAFKTYKLFLDAIAEEHAGYANFLRDDLLLHKEVIAGMRLELERVKEEAKQEIAVANKERDDMFALMDGDRQKHKKLLQRHEEAQMKEKNTESDVKKQLLDLEQRNATLNAETKRQRQEIEILLRQVENLSLTTFSDALETANHALTEWKATAAVKEEAIFAAHDETADLARDLRRTVEYFHARLDYDLHLQAEDIKLSYLGLRTLFPEAAAAKRHQAELEKEESQQPQHDRAVKTTVVGDEATPAINNSDRGSSGAMRKKAGHDLANFLPYAK